MTFLLCLLSEAHRGEGLGIPSPHLRRQYWSGGRGWARWWPLVSDSPCSWCPTYYCGAFVLSTYGSTVATCYVSLRRPGNFTRFLREGGPRILSSFFVVLLDFLASPCPPLGQRDSRTVRTFCQRDSRTVRTFFCVAAFVVDNSRGMLVAGYAGSTYLMLCFLRCRQAYLFVSSTYPPCPWRTWRHDGHRDGPGIMVAGEVAALVIDIVSGTFLAGFDGDGASAAFFVCGRPMISASWAVWRWPRSSSTSAVACSCCLAGSARRYAATALWARIAFRSPFPGTGARPSSLDVRIFYEACPQGHGHN